MFVKTLNGKYHLINESFYNDLAKNVIICENNEMCLYEEVDWKKVENEQFYPVVLQDIKKLGVDITKINNETLKKLIATIIDNIGDSYTIDTTKQYLEKSGLLNNQNNQTQQNQAQEELQNNQEDNKLPEDPNVETTSEEQSEEMNKKGQEFINKNIRIYVNQIRKYGMEKEVLDFINKSTQSKYTSLLQVPVDILLNVVSNYKPIREKLLTDRFKASLNNYNIPDNMKQDILKYYQDEEKNNQDWSTLFPKIMNHNSNQTIFDFPIAEYYITKYNTNMAAKIYDFLGEYIYNEIHPSSTMKQLFGGDEDVKAFADRLGITENDSKEEISKKIERLFGSDIVQIIMNYNKNALDGVSIYDDEIDEKHAKELLKIFGSKQIIQQADVSEAVYYIKLALNDAGLFPFIDYIIKQYEPNISGTKDVQNSNQLIAKINLFTDYNVSAIINNLTKNKEFSSKWEIGYQTRTNNAIYDNVYNVPLTNKASGLTGNVLFVSGFALLNIFKKNFKKGYQYGKGFKGFF